MNYLKRIIKDLNTIENCLETKQYGLIRMQLDTIKSQLNKSIDELENYFKEIEVSKLIEFLNKGSPWRDNDGKRVINLNRIASALSRGEIKR